MIEIINQSIVNLPIPDFAEISIENAARTCYKTEDRIGCQKKDDVECEDFDAGCRDQMCEYNSANKLSNLLVSREHFPATEMCPLVMKVAPETGEKIAAILSTGLYHGVWCEPVGRTFAIVSGNFRGLMHVGKMMLTMGDASILDACLEKGPLLAELMGYEYENHNASMSVYELCDPQLPIAESKDPAVHMWAMSRWVTNRGVTHELVRHRIASFMQESTRYCDYKGQPMQFIRPVWASDEVLGQWDAEGSREELGISKRAEELFVLSCMEDAYVYQELRKESWAPQFAREVLPNALKTEIVVMANCLEWQHIFHMRCASDAHPQIQQLAREYEPVVQKLTGMDVVA